MQLLFVCSRNLMRSPTVETVFSTYAGVEALSAGTSPDAETPLSLDLIEWADIIFVMEANHRRLINQRFAKAMRDKQLVVLEIPDVYAYMDPPLVALLKAKVTPYLKSGGLQSQ